jgi:hypothetical protein
MKKITIPIFIFSIAFYLLFYFILFDAPTAISNASLVACLVLSIINLVNSVVVIRENQRENVSLSPLPISVFTVNLVFFLLFTAYLLAVYFLPYNISIG